MMGTKTRNFAPLIHVSLEELVPKDHFYRHLERTLDLSFVREFVPETYAGKGRPSIDPLSSSNCNWSCFLRTSALSASSCDMEPIDSVSAGIWGMTWVKHCPIIRA